MEIKGILQIKLGEASGTSQRTGTEWRNAEYLIDIPGSRPRKVKIKVNNGTGEQNRIARFDSFLGKNVDVSFDIDAHEYQGRWFNELIAWGIMEYVPEQVTIGQAETPKSDLPFDQPQP